MPRWSHEGEDAAALARAILSGKLTDQIQSFKDFFDPDTGEGAEIGKRYEYFTEKGKRNLKLNWLKLYRKVKLWQSNEKDPDTNKYVKFSKSFLSKANFPTREERELIADVPDEDKGDFVPGRDQFFEKIVEDEREEEKDTDSLTAVGAGNEDYASEQDDVDQPPTPTPPTPTPPTPPPVAMPAKKKFPTTLMQQSRNDPKYTLGRHLARNGDGVSLAMTKALQEHWTHITRKCKQSSDGGREPKEYKEYSLKLPEPCEREFRDPIGSNTMCCLSD